MASHKSFASLTGSMLARKTALRPALEAPPAGSNDLDGPLLPAAAQPANPAEIGAAAEPLLAGTPMLAAKVVPLIRPAPVPSRPAGLNALPVRRSRPAAFTLRLDPDRHLRLRLACSLQSRSAQALVTEAVDRLLSDLPEIEALADRIGAHPIVRPLRDTKP